MFSIWCPGHGARVLLTTAHITELRNTPAGPEVDWRCQCGERGTWRPRREHRRALAAVPPASEEGPSAA